jgi:hypothetical protein
VTRLSKYLVTNDNLIEYECECEYEYRCAEYEYEGRSLCSNAGWEWGHRCGAGAPRSRGGLRDRKGNNERNESLERRQRTCASNQHRRRSMVPVAASRTCRVPFVTFVPFVVAFPGRMSSAQIAHFILNPFPCALCVLCALCGHSPGLR